MTELNRTLNVPEDEALRNKLRKEAKKKLVELNLLPPMGFTQMEQLATELLKTLGVSEDYIDFTIVLLGNESWRATVEATPFNRRLLLLPQCLKSKDHCKGVFDELGLNCAACKACPVDDILLAAESLGYATLVAEGTTFAIGLVEEGAIDAVIGVSCMPVLQRSFEPVSNAAVPVIGIPLMYDGCENTKLDLPWLYDELKAYRANDAIKPLSISALKNKIDEYFKSTILQHQFTINDETENIAKSFLQVGGQRIRPLIAALSYRAYAPLATDEMVYSLAFIIECFHKASLIHDDIQDKTDHRYNEATTHKKHGIAQAINAGDYLIGKGYKTLAELPVSSKILVKGLKTVADSHLKLTHGQGADLRFTQGQMNLGVDETLEIFKNKTGEAIKVALLLGAILGEAEDSELQILNDFSALFGIAFQIRDDLQEFRLEEKDEKIADFPFLVALFNESNEAQYDNDLLTFRKKILELGLDKKADQLLANYIKRCYNALDKLSNARLRLSLYGVLGKIFKTTNVEAEA